MRGNIILIKFCFVSIILFSSCTQTARTKEDIYKGFFGKEKDDCVQILEARDARALDDCCVWLHFKACPNEIKRILSLVPYKRKLIKKEMMKFEFTDPSQIDEEMISTDPPKWWSLKKLGDSCFKFECFHADKDYAQFAYVSPDSTEIFYHDSSW